MKPRTFVIGDIHGAFRALEQVLERAAVTTSDKLIFLGDYVDGWSQSKQTIEKLMELAKDHDCTFIRGNHDTWCEDWLADRGTNAVWVNHGGSETISSYDSIDKEERNSHCTFFGKMENYLIDEDNNLFIHAGFSSMHGPKKEQYSSNYKWDRTLWEMALAMNKNMDQDDIFYPKRLKLFNEIYIGHTPTTNYRIETPINAVNVWNIDTGAAFTGKLTILDTATKEFWQSDSVTTLYPNERGRNK